MNPAQHEYIARHCADKSTAAGYLDLPRTGTERATRGYAPGAVTLTFDDGSALHMQQSPRDPLFCWSPPADDLRSALLGGREEHIAERELRREHSRQREALRRLAVIEQLFAECELSAATALNLQIERRTLLAGW